MDEIFKKLNYQPTGLSDIELNNPERIVESFFENCPIHSIRESLWEHIRGGPIMLLNIQMLNKSDQ